MKLDARVLHLLSTFSALHTRQIARALGVQLSTALCVLSALSHAKKVKGRGGHWTLA